jgi:hypothetical protein
MINILSGNAYLSIKGKSGTWYKYIIRKSFNPKCKGMFYVIVKIDNVKHYIGFFRRSTCALGRGNKGELSREHEAFETMRLYLRKTIKKEEIKS